MPLLPVKKQIVDEIEDKHEAVGVKVPVQTRFGVTACEVCLRREVRVQLVVEELRRLLRSIKGTGKLDELGTNTAGITIVRPFR